MLADRIDAVLPQTQCTRCGYPDCRGYAEALAGGDVPINRCPPGGAEGIARLAKITGQTVTALDPACGAEGPIRLARIDEDWCIGCTLCIKACPVDCIVGAPKQMHTVIESLCTGCELCIPACPVDCIRLHAQDNRTGWAAWSTAQAGEARSRYKLHQIRQERTPRENGARLLAKAETKLQDLVGASAITDSTLLDRKRATIEAAIIRARAQRKSEI